MKSQGLIITAEITEHSTSLSDINQQFTTLHISDKELFVIVGNEVTGVEQESLTQSDIVCHIPMLGSKESLNVGQAAAIIMRELQKL